MRVISSDMVVLSVLFRLVELIILGLIIELEVMIGLIMIYNHAGLMFGSQHPRDIYIRSL